MSHPEHDQPHRPEQPAQLPPELAAFLKDQELACLMQATNQGTAFVIKAPSREIDSLAGQVPMRLRHELYAHPLSPVIRTVVTIYDQPDTPLALESFTNVEDAQQRSDFAALADQDDCLLLCYDEALAHRLTKRVPLTGQEVVTAVVARADQLLAAIPPERFDFDRAKLAIMEATTL